MAFGSDAGSMAPEGVFLKSSTHPRAYGNFERLLAGMEHVFVNGVAVFEDGEHTGALPGRFVRGPGYKQAQ